MCFLAQSRSHLSSTAFQLSAVTILVLNVKKYHWKNSTLNTDPVIKSAIVKFARKMFNGGVIKLRTTIMNDVLFLNTCMNWMEISTDRTNSCEKLISKQLIRFVVTGICELCLMSERMINSIDNWMWASNAIFIRINSRINEIKFHPIQWNDAMFLVSDLDCYQQIWQVHILNSIRFIFHRWNSIKSEMNKLKFGSIVEKSSFAIIYLVQRLRSFRWFP